MEEINSKIIGSLRHTSEDSDNLYSAPIQIPFFDNQEIVFRIEESSDDDLKYFEEVDFAIQNFLKLDNKYRLSTSKLIHKNCKETYEDMELEDIEDEEKELFLLKNSKKIWDYVEAYSITVSRRDRRDKDIYVLVECSCEWEPEHNLQLVFRNGQQLTRVSDVDFHLTESDAYDIPDEEDKLLNQFGKKSRIWWQFWK